MKAKPITKSSDIPKSYFLNFHKKIVRDCKRDLKTMTPDDPAYRIVNNNMIASQNWVKFLSNPDVPELNDPKFKTKMKKLDKPKDWDEKPAKKAKKKVAA